MAGLLSDIARGGAMGLSTDLLGTPVDLLTMLLRPLGYKTEKPVMGSEWLADKLGVKQSGSVPEQAARFATGLLSPGPGELAQGMGLLGAIKAYHGSPHKFDKFDMSKIGTGEGAQAYGHGLYFSESPDVAKSYQHGLSDWKPDGVTLKPGSIEDRAAAWVAEAIDSGSQHPIPTAIQKVKRLEENPETRDALLKVIGEWSAKGTKWTRGNMYETSLRWPDAAREAADPLGPQHFLDWDKPLSQQSADVQNAARKAIGIGDGPAWVRRADSFPAVVTDAEQIAQLNRLAKTSPKMVADEGYRLTDPLSLMTGKDLHFSLGGRAIGSKANGEKALLSAGIPGIRYLDAGSRGSGQGTANYVAFDDALVEILKRNGLAP